MNFRELLKVVAMGSIFIELFVESSDKISSLRNGFSGFKNKKSLGKDEGKNANWVNP